MKFKHIFQGVLAASAVLLLASCGKTSESKDSATGKGASSATELVKKDRVKKGTLEVYVPEGKNADFLKAALKNYNSKYSTDLKLKVVDTAPSTAMVQKITPKLVSKEKMPEMIFLQDDNAGSIFNKFSSRFYSSEDFGFIKKYGSDFYSAKMSMLANIAPDHKTYGFPNDWGNAAMFYNDAAFKEAGVDVTKDVKNWDDLIKAGKELKNKTGKKLVFMRDTGELDLIKYITQQQGLSLFDKKGNLNLMKPEVKKAYAIVKELQDADLVEYGNSKDYTAIGQKCGVMFVGGWEASYQGTDYPADKGQWRIGAMPAVKAGSKAYSPMSGGSSYYVPKNSDNPLAALQFISFALTDAKSLEAYMNLSGLPANTIAYESAAANKGFDYYGGQKILQTLNDISKQSVHGYAFPYSADLDNYIEAASYDVKKNGTSVEKALKKQADEFAAKYNVKVNK